jgi:methyl-accepting chemotaxis protein
MKEIEALRDSIREMNERVEMADRGRILRDAVDALVSNSTTNLETVLVALRVMVRIYDRAQEA